MAAPSHTVRVAPTGYKLPEGWQSVFALSGANSINLFERDLKPPGIDGGEPIDTTTQFNTVWMTKFPRHLKSMMPFNFTAGYDARVWSAVRDQINVPQSMTFYWPDGSYVDFWGVLNKFEEGELKSGEFPTASCAITPINCDPATQLESGPVFFAAAGT